MVGDMSLNFLICKRELVTLILQVYRFIMKISERMDAVVLHKLGCTIHMEMNFIRLKHMKLQISNHLRPTKVAISYGSIYNCHFPGLSTQRWQICVFGDAGEGWSLEVDLY
jgi:hypothetical protein